MLELHKLVQRIYHIGGEGGVLIEGVQALARMTPTAHNAMGRIAIALVAACLLVACSDDDSTYGPRR